MYNRIESLVDELNCPPKTINSLFVILRPCHVDNSRFIQCNVDNNDSEYLNGYLFHIFHQIVVCRLLSGCEVGR